MQETATVLNISETQEVESKALALPEKAHLIVVDSNDGMEMADKTVSDITDMIKEIDSTFKPLADKAFQAHRAITGKWNEVKKPLEEAKTYLVNQIKGYQRKLRELKEAEEARLREIARKEEEERRLREAEALEAEGRTEEVEEILNEPITYVAPAVKIETPKVDNRMYRTTLKVKVNDRIKFLSAVKPETLVELLNESAWTTIENGLAKKAKALGKAFNFQGCTVTEA